MTTAGIVPTSAVIELFRHELDGSGDQPDDPLLRLLLDLHRNNIAQWGFEDETRRPGAAPASIADAKREIDRLNAKRHGFVEAVDATIDAAIAQTPTATPATESPGMVYDRLSVLVLRLHHTELAVRAEQSSGSQYAQRLPVLDEQLVVLEEALDALLADVRAGTRRFVPYQHLKLYTPKPLTRLRSRAAPRSTPRRRRADTPPG